MKVKIFRGIGALLALLLFTSELWSYSWPVTPTNQQHIITATLGEYRSTGRFHLGVDIGESGVHFYAVTNGIVNGILRTGIDSYIQVGNIHYIHVTADSKLNVNDVINIGDDLGTISGNHIHLQE